MDIEKLCCGLGLDSDVKTAVLRYDKENDYEKISDSIEKLYSRESWGSGIEELKEYCGDDERGFKILSICMHCLLRTYDSYMEKGISEKIFFDTAGFIPRFLNEHKRVHGISAFTWAHWIPRQIAMEEFRIGDYEYELIDDGEEKKISLHIPSDADLANGDIEAVYPFLERYYPEYLGAEMICSSWLLVPALKDLLNEDSNIVRFQNRFYIYEVDEESLSFMDWVYSSREIPYSKLPEGTTLQRNMKKYLLSGGKIGWARGTYRK